MVSLASTCETLRLVNGSGNRFSHEAEAAKFNKAIAQRRAAGFRPIRLRPGCHVRAGNLPESAWKPLKRLVNYQAKIRKHRQPKRVKQQIAEERGFKTIRVVDQCARRIQHITLTIAMIYY